MPTRKHAHNNASPMLSISEEHHSDSNSTMPAINAVVISGNGNGINSGSNNNNSVNSNAPPTVPDGSLWTASYDYEAQGEDELSLRRGQIVVVLSMDSNISGDEGWWTGKIGDKVSNRFE